MPKIVAVDTETRGLGWYNEDERAFLMTWSDERGDHAAWEDDATSVEEAFAALKAADIIVCHNLPFDVHQIRETWGEDLTAYDAELVDTDTLARVVVPERRTKGDDDNDRGTHGFKLEHLSKTYLPEDEQKIGASLEELAKAAGIKLKTKGGYYDLGRAYPEEMEEYAKRDTRATLALLPKLEAKLTDTLRPTWDLERTVQPHLIRAEAHGIAVDQSRVEPLKVRYTAKRDEAYGICFDAFGEGVLADPEDPESKENADSLREALVRLGIPLYRKVASCEHDGEDCDCPLATNKYALQEFTADFPVIQALFDYRQARKFLATYIGPMDGREVVHPTYWQIGAWTGRMSCSRPNMQNLPVRGEGSSDLRAMFVPRPGHVLVVSDFDAIEARLLAYYLGRRGVSYREMIANGHDVHAWMASQIWGGTPEQYAKGGPNDKLRSLAKNVLFAIVYGAGGGRVLDMLLDVGMGTTGPEHFRWSPGKPRCRCEGCSLARAIKSAVPGYHQLNKRVKNKVKDVGHVNTILGRRQPVKKDKEYVGLNALIQGSAADIFKQAITNVSEAGKPYRAQPILFVHDEIGTECPIEYAEEFLPIQNAAMVAAFDLDPELAVTGTICHNNYSEGK